MNWNEIQLWSIAAWSIGALIAIELIRRFRKARPCWFFGHNRKHLSIELRIWNGMNGNCGQDCHTYHYKSACYVTKWICVKTGCDEMGYFCAGEKTKGAWTIRSYRMRSRNPCGSACRPRPLARANTNGSSRRFALTGASAGYCSGAAPAVPGAGRVASYNRRTSRGQV